MMSKMSASDALLEDIREVNRIQAENGLPTLTAGSSSSASSSIPMEEKKPEPVPVVVKPKTMIVGKILKPISKGGVSEPFH